MLVHIKTLVGKAQRHGYAIGAFNTANLEITQGIVRAAVAKRSPVIVQVSEATIKYAGLKPITHIVETIAKNEAVDIPVALHLDHGRDFHTIAECLHAGFSSIHIDASDLPLDENIAVTRQSVDYAHRFHAWAQGELGSILGKEGQTKVEIPDDPDRYMTDPSVVRRYVAATRVDTLAVSVGTMHGFYRGKEHVDSRRLAAISRLVRKPLVLHGGSGLSRASVRTAIRHGIRIINIDTELRMAFTETLRRTLRRKLTSYDPRKILGPATDAIQRVAEGKLAVFGSVGRA